MCLELTPARSMLFTQSRRRSWIPLPVLMSLVYVALLSPSLKQRCPLNLDWWCWASDTASRGGRVRVGLTATLPQPRLRQYYEPLRHPSQPGLSLASCQLIHTAITAGTSRVAHGPLCLHAVATTPAGRMEFVRSNDSIRFGLPSNRGGSAPALTVSGPAQRSLTLRPARSPSRLCDSLHQRLQQSRCLHCCSDCYRVERTSSRAGIPPLWTSAFSRRTRVRRLSRLSGQLLSPWEPSHGKSCVIGSVNGSSIIWI